MQLFGFGNTDKKQKKAALRPSFVPPSDSETTIDVVSQTNRFGVEFDKSATNTKQQIDTYRGMAGNSDIISAIDEIVNAAIVNDPDKAPVELVTDKVEGVSDNIKTKMADEFKSVVSLFNFNDAADDIFRQWYIDGRLYYHIVLDEKRPANGIEELRQIDPRKIKKVREILKEKSASGIDIVTGVKEYYVFEDDDLHSSNKALEIPTEAIICATSGLKSADGKEIISYLEPAIKPFNQLVALEDSLVIYRIARAPERRVFYVDVGNLPPTRADQYMRKTINAHKNKTIYDSVTGSIKDNKHIMSMMEDIWLPRVSGNRSTEVSTLPGGQGLGEMDDVLYFMKKLYKAMRIPAGRLDTENSMLQTGIASEITRDEVKFAKFIDKIRKKFSRLFKHALRTQLILKNVITAEDWEKISNHLQFKFNSDSAFTEIKEAEIIGRRLDLLQTADQFAGKYLSIETIRKNILNQSEDDYKEEDKRMAAEKKSGLYPEE